MSVWQENLFSLTIFSCQPNRNSLPECMFLQSQKVLLPRDRKPGGDPVTPQGGMRPKKIKIIDGKFVMI